MRLDVGLNLAMFDGECGEARGFFLLGECLQMFTGRLVFARSAGLRRLSASPMCCMGARGFANGPLTNDAGLGLPAKLRPPSLQVSRPASSRHPRLRTLPSPKDSSGVSPASVNWKHASHNGPRNWRAARRSKCLSRHTYAADVEPEGPAMFSRPGKWTNWWLCG